MPRVDLARHRNWAVVAMLVVVVVVVAVIAGGLRSRGPRPTVAFGAQVPVRAADLNYNNGWTARAGRRMIAVFAGSQSVNKRNGLLIVARTASGHRRIKEFVLHGTGGVTLLKPPAPRSEDDAYDAILRFVTANGATGILDLGHNREALNR